MKIRKISSAPAVYLVDKNYRVTLYSDSLVRLEYTAEGVFDDENPLILEPTFREEVPHSLVTNDLFALKTPRFAMELIPDGKCFDIGNLKIRVFGALNGETVFEPGIEDADNLGGAQSDLYKYPAGKIYESFTPGLVSKNGYFVYRNHCDFLRDEKTGWIKKRSSSDFQDWCFFACGTDYKKAFADFIGLFGKIPMIPRWALGYWYSRWHKFRDEDILGVVEKFRELGIPLDVFVIDTDWRKRGWNGYEWNSDFFGDPARFVSNLKKLGIKCCLNDHPGYGVSDELPSDDPYRAEIKKVLPDISDFRVQWNDDRYVRAWTQKIFTKILDEGIDFWWVDGWGASGGIMDLHSQMWLNRFYYEAAANARDGRRAMILSRWGGVGSHKYPVQFSGDTYSTFETIKRQISFTHQGGNIGAAYWSHDIGGFLGKNIDEELFIRWVEFGCFSPILRTHSSGASRDVWNYSEEAVSIFKKYVRARYALNPYLYSLARECRETGTPPFRGIYVEYPRDANCYDYREQYLIGASLMVAPAYSPGRISTRITYFPEGAWIPLEDGGIIKGKRSRPIDVAIDKIALFARAGSIIPTTAPVERLGAPENLEFLVFPSGDETFFDYYEDDGVTNACENGAYLKRRVVARSRGPKVSIKLSAAVGGSYDGAPETQEISFLVFGGRGIAKRVLVGGKITEFSTINKILGGTLDSRFNFARVDIGRVAPRDEISVEVIF